MYAVTVHIQVKPGALEAFVAATLSNAQATVEEPENLRFDVLQQQDDPNRFTLVEVYKDSSGMDAHKETAHYATWRDTVADMMAETRYGVKHQTLFPEAATNW
jgi:(4S)-4-hydroxy-5-phosphonooxypentane-2,3-dione isomerase